MMKAESIVIQSITKPDEKSLHIDFIIPFTMEKYFIQKSFFASYDVSIEKVPDSILVIPLLSNLLPVAWANNVDVFVDEIDETFYKTIPILKQAFQKLYPKLTIKGQLKANKVIKNEVKSSNRASQLFSGGIDSLTTFIRRIEESPYLITIWGADVKLNELEAWKQVENYNKKLAEDLQTEILFVKSNFKDFLNQRQLKDEFGPIVTSWWAGVQHGFGLAGLCSPITYVKGIDTFYIGSSHTADYKLPYGSHPSIDNQVRWANTKVVHDSYDLTRQEKIKVVSNYIKQKSTPLQIRVCWLSGEKGGNCNKCEKCSRTILGLLLSGLNPNKHGFHLIDDFPSHIKTQFVTKNWKISEAVAFQWKDIQNNIPSKVESRYIEYNNFLLWLKNYKFKKEKPNLIVKSRPIIVKLLPERSKVAIKKFVKFSH